MVGEMGSKKRGDESRKRTGDSPAHERFRDHSHIEHRELRDTYQRDYYATRRQARDYG